MRYKTLSALIAAAVGKGIIRADLADEISSTFGIFPLNHIWDKLDSLRSAIVLRPNHYVSITIAHYFNEDLQELRFVLVGCSQHNDLSHKQIGLIAALLNASIIDEYKKIFFVNK